MSVEQVCIYVYIYIYIYIYICIYIYIYVYIYIYIYICVCVCMCVCVCVFVCVCVCVCMYVYRANMVNQIVLREVMSTVYYITPVIYNSLKVYATEHALGCKINTVTRMLIVVIPIFFRLP